MQREGDVLDLWFARQACRWWRRWRWPALAAGSFFVLSTGLQLANILLTNPRSGSAPNWLDTLLHSQPVMFPIAGNRSMGFDPPESVLTLLCNALAAVIWASLADMLAAIPPEIMVISGQEAFYQACRRRLRRLGYLIFGLEMLLPLLLTDFVRSYVFLKAFGNSLHHSNFVPNLLGLSFTLCVVCTVVEPTFFLAMYWRLGWGRAMAIVWGVHFLILTGPGALCAEVLLKNDELDLPIAVAGFLIAIYCVLSARRQPDLRLQR